MGSSTTGAVRPGSVLAGKYRIERQLGEGGMGVVLRATHLTLGKPRAIKVMRADLAANAGATRRFLREARAASDLQSEHVAKVLDVDQLPGGEPYMVMEHLEGTDLAAVLAAHGNLPVDESVYYVSQACEALAEAHARGLVHRDIKPANLFLTRRADGSPSIKVLDFGIAKAASDEADPQGLTGGGALLGTLRYVSPEQVVCASDVNARSDLWALGVVLYELVCGHPPFRDESTMRLLARITETAPPPFSDAPIAAPPGFEEVVMRCLEKDRNKRYSSAAELREALAPFAPDRGQPVIDRLSSMPSSAGAAELAGSEDATLSARPEALAPPVGPRPSRPSTPAPRAGAPSRRGRTALLLLAALAVAGASAVVLARRGDTPSPGASRTASVSPVGGAEASSSPSVSASMRPVPAPSAAASAPAPAALSLLVSPASIAPSTGPLPSTSAPGSRTSAASAAPPRAALAPGASSSAQPKRPLFDAAGNPIPGEANP